MATTETAPSCCAVCLDDLRTELSALPCGHVLHHLCATRALREVQQCPICRKRAKYAVRLFYTAGARSSKRTLASPSSASAVAAATSSLQSASSSHHANSIDQKFAALRKSVLRLAADQRMVSNHSFRLETENVRLRQESSRAADQLASAHSKIDTLTKELDVWKRIATRSHTQLQELRVETSAADRELLASMQTLTHELQTFSLPSLYIAMNDIIKEGAVSVRSHFLWRERFVVIKKGQVLIFRRRDGSVKTKIDLLQPSVKLTFHSENSHIAIAHAQGKDVVLDCHTTHARDTWLSALFTARGRLEVDTESDLILSGDDSDESDVDTIAMLVEPTTDSATVSRQRRTTGDDNSDADNDDDIETDDREYSDALLAFQDVRSSMMQCHLAMSMAKEDLFVAPDASLQRKHHHIHATRNEEAARVKCIKSLVAYIESAPHGGRVVLLHLGVLASAGIRVDDLLLALGAKQSETPRRASLTSTTISRHKLHVATFVRDMLFHAVYSKRPEVQTEAVNALIDRYFSHCRLRRFSHDDEQMALMSVHPLELGLGLGLGLDLATKTLVVNGSRERKSPLQPPPRAAATMSKAEMLVKKKRHSFPNLFTPLRTRAGLLDATKLEELLLPDGSGSMDGPTDVSERSAAPALETRNAASSSTSSSISSSSSAKSLTPHDSGLYRDASTPAPLRSLLWRNSCVEIAEQMTLFHHAQLARLSLWDVLHNPREAAKDISESFNRLVTYFVWSVLLEDAPKDRAEVIENIISIALAASSVALNNFHLVMACVGCLGDTPLMVSRLPATWKRVRNKFKTHLRELRTLCDHTGGFENLRKRQTIMSVKSCCVPFIGVVGVALERLRATTYFTDKTTLLDFDKLERQYAALHVLENCIQRPYRHVRPVGQMHVFLAELTMEFTTPRLLQLRSQQILSLESASGSSGGSANSLRHTSFLQPTGSANASGSLPTSSTSSLTSPNEANESIAAATTSPSFLSFAHICSTLATVPVVRERVEIGLEALFADDRQFLTRQLRRFWLEFKTHASVTACHTTMQSVRTYIDALMRDVLATKAIELQQISGLDENAQELQRIVYDKVVRTVTQPVFAWLFAKVKHTFKTEDASVRAFAIALTSSEQRTELHAALEHQQLSFRSIGSMQQQRPTRASSPVDLAAWLTDCIETEHLTSSNERNSSVGADATCDTAKALVPTVDAAHRLLSTLCSDEAHLYSVFYILQQLFDTALLSPRLRDAISALEQAITFVRLGALEHESSS